MNVYVYIVYIPYCIALVLSVKITLYADINLDSVLRPLIKVQFEYW